jgi:hypothetical protein
MLPLTGINVLDLSHLLPGPFCTWILAEFGADVLKIKPLGGEAGHKLPPTTDNSSSYFYLALNRGKCSFHINLKHPLGKEILDKLAANAERSTRKIIRAKELCAACALPCESPAATARKLFPLLPRRNIPNPPLFRLGTRFSKSRSLEKKG